MRGGQSRSVFIEAPFTVETGEAERIAVDWTSKGGQAGTSCMFSLLCNALVRKADRVLVQSHLQSQRAAVKMLHDRIMVLVQYVADVIAGVFILSPYL